MSTVASTVPAVEPAIDPTQLLEPMTLASGLVLPNRIVMSPMTRNRASPDGMPNALMAQYYAQRSSAGLIITESASVSPFGRGYFGAPEIANDAQQHAWATVTQAVHERGGRIFLQINHYGRCSSRFMLPGGALPVAPSSVGISRKSRLVTIACPRVTPYDVPRELTTDEVAVLVAAFREAGQRAIAAGFDGIEVHADSGYLIHQFLSTNVNRRRDRYGGNVENRARFLLEIVAELSAAIGPQRVAVKLTPGWNFHEIEEPDAVELYGYIADRLKALQVVFVHLFDPAGLDTELFQLVRSRYAGPIVAEASLGVPRSAAAAAAGQAELFAFGRLFIGNPDLPQRVAQGVELTQPDADTFYSQGPEGYVDYPPATSSP